MAQIMACCLMVPSHNLKQCWLKIIDIPRNAFFTENAHNMLAKIIISNQIFYGTVRGQWVKEMALVPKRQEAITYHHDDLDHRRYLQSSAIITWCNIVRYYMNDYKNWGRISIRCCIHKRRLPTLTGKLWAVFCEYLWENWPRYNGTTS